MATPQQVQRRGRWSLILGTIFAALMLAAVAYADNLKDTLAAGSVPNPSISEGGSFTTTINYQVDKTGSNNTSFPAAVSFALSGAPAWVSASVSSLSFAGYADVKSITVSGTAPSGSAGTYNFSLVPTTSATDLNVSPATVAMSVSVSAPAPPPDLTAPVITPAIDGTLGNNGWYTSNVIVSWTVEDDESNISSQNGCQAVTITADQASTDYTCSATSAGGTSSKTVSIKRDATAPLISSTGYSSGAAGLDGWYTTAVANGFSASDAPSGLADCASTFTQSSGTAEGSAVTINSGSCSDNAGNTNSGIGSGTYKIDLSNPTVSSWTGLINSGDSFYFGSVPAAPTCTAADTISGPKSCGVTGYSTTVGSHTLLATATDNAGRTGTDSRGYSVLAWTLSGFFQPVDMGASVWNTVKNGSTVPLKFRVFAGSTELKDPANVNMLKALAVGCTGGQEDAIEELASTSSSGLRYDMTAGQFIYNWQTPKKPGSCYRVTIGTADGSILEANFKLK